jgi:hypothetical protein
MYGAVSAAIRLAAAWGEMVTPDAVFSECRFQYYYWLKTVLNDTSLLLPELKRTAHDAGISERDPLDARSSAGVDQLLAKSLGRPLKLPF